MPNFKTRTMTFPQRIAYRKVDADRLYVLVDNLDPDPNRQLSFNFIRTKND